MKLMIAGLVLLGSMLLRALAEMLAEVVGDAAIVAVTPWWRRRWQAVVRARWHWPLLLITALGAAGLVAGSRLHELPDWRGDAGAMVFIAGGAVAAVAFILWRDARRARAGTTEKPSATPPSRPAA